MRRVFSIGAIIVLTACWCIVPAGYGQEKQASPSNGLPNYEAVHRRFPHVPFFFFSKTGIRIDVEVRKSQVRLRSADLWISRDFGKTWKKARGARDGRAGGGWYIDYEFPGEGLYGIHTTGTDVAGNQMQPPEQGDPPAMFIYIDRTNPDVSFGSEEESYFLPPSRGSVKVNWNVTDPTLDTESVLVSVSRDDGKSWTEFSRGKASVSKKPVPFNGSDSLLIRISARDRAGNRALYRTDYSFRRAENWDHYRTRRKSGWPTPPFASASRNVKIQFSLPAPRNPKDTSNDLQVMLYYTTDGGRSWKRAEVKQLQGESAVLFSAPDDGYYGFYLNFSYPNSTAYRPYPESGTEPDSRTLIDTKPPTVDLVAPKARDKLEAGDRVNIIYNAFDTYFPDKPVSLYYSTNGGEHWKLIKRGLAPEGLYNWKVPDEPTSDLRLKVEARDMAGQVSSDISPKPLYIPGDPKKSPARIRSVASTEEKMNGDDGSGAKTNGGDGTGDAGMQRRKWPTVGLSEKVNRWMKMALQHKRRREFQKACHYFRKVLEKHPDFENALEGLGLCLYNLGKYAESESVFRKLIALSPKKDRAYLYYNLGCALYMQEKFDESADQLYRSLEGGLGEKFKDTGAEKVAFEKLVEIAHQFLRENRKEKALEYLNNLQKRNLQKYPGIQKRVKELLDKHST